MRHGTVFELPGIVLQVAQECSGIRSSWVLLITSLLASHLFLKNPVAKDRAGGLRDSARHLAERVPDPGHRTALRTCRART